MVKKLLLALMALCSAQMASAQSFPKPPDVPAYVVVTPQYEAGLNVRNRKQTPTDIPPANAYELADIPTVNPSQLTAGGAQSCLPIGAGGTDPGCTESKFRTLVAFTHILGDDPIRNYGLPGSSHLHLFFGNRSTNAFSTYSTLRGKSAKFSRAAGGGRNGVGYWMPSMLSENPFGDGKNYAPLPGVITVYYADLPVNSSQLKRMPNGLRYVAGYQMDDGGASMQAIVTSANAASAAAGGSATRYAMPGNGASHAWSCRDSGGSTVIPRTVTTTGSTHFVEADGSDPWGGTCVAGSYLGLNFGAASCWDGVNLWSPGGYKHIIPAVYDQVEFNADTTDNGYVCPKNHYRLPSLQLNFAFKHQGFTQFKNWKLSSDPIVGTANVGTMNGQTLRRGDTFHADWMDGWDQATKRAWLDFCLGTLGNTPHQCNDSTFGPGTTDRLILTEANPQTGRSPQVNTALNSPNQTAAQMYLLPSVNKKTGAITVHVHGTPANPGRTLFVEGDSISFCGASGGADCTGSFTYSQQYSSANNYAVEKGWAVSGSGLNDVEARKATLIAAKPLTGPWTVSLLIGANDLSGVTDTTAYMNRIKAYAASLKAAGAKVVVSTVLQNGAGAAASIAAHNSNRAVINPAIRQMVTDGLADAVADYAADPIMGPDNSYSANTGYWADVTHPNGSGHTRLQVIYSLAVSRAFQK